MVALKRAKRASNNRYQYWKREEEEELRSDETRAERVRRGARAGVAAAGSREGEENSKIVVVVALR